MNPFVRGEKEGPGSDIVEKSEATEPTSLRARRLCLKVYLARKFIG